MTHKHEVEARLDRALKEQISAPRLDRRFDAAVWARIDAEQSRATNPGKAAVRASRVSRWLAISNAVGITVAVVLALYFGLQMFGNVDMSFNFEIPLPELSGAQTNVVMTAGSYLIALAALVIGLAFTSFGRRVRSSIL